MSNSILSAHPLLLQCPVVMHSNEPAQTLTNAKVLAKWLEQGRGLAVWENKDLGSSNVGKVTFTPALQSDMQSLKQSPHWRYSNEPKQYVLDPALVLVEPCKEVGRLYVAFRNTSLGMNDRSLRALDTMSQRLRMELATKGDSSEGLFNAIDWADEDSRGYVACVLYVPLPSVPLLEFIKANS